MKNELKIPKDVKVEVDYSKTVAPITLKMIRLRAVRVVVTGDRITAYIPIDNGEYEIYLHGYYNAYYPDGLNDNLWEEYVLNVVARFGATPAALRYIRQLREWAIENLSDRLPEFETETVVVCRAATE